MISPIHRLDKIFYQKLRPWVHEFLIEKLNASSREKKSQRIDNVPRYDPNLKKKHMMILILSYVFVIYFIINDPY